MRRLPPWLWLLLALVFGATATFMALGWMKNQSQRQVVQAPKMPTAPVVVAAKDVDAANALKVDQLSVVQWPKDTLPKGGFSSAEEATGRVATLPISAGEPILEPKLAPKGTPAGMVALVSPHKRAMTVKVDEASGVAGFIIPNNRVDVLVSINRGEFSNDPLAKVVLTNLRVLGTGQKIIQKEPDGKPQVVPTVTLEVTPEEGERLALAASEGHIALVLRGQKDDAPVDTRGIKTTQLFRSASVGEGPAKESNDGSFVQIIRRQKVDNVNSLESFSKPASKKM
jgi:pilus assembly protein CpaB